MLIRLNSAVTAGAIAFEPGDVIDWRSADPKSPDATAKRMVEKGLAEPVEAKELGQGQKTKRFTEPAPRPEDKWPPRPGKPRPDQAHLDADQKTY